MVKKKVKFNYKKNLKKAWKKQKDKRTPNVTNKTLKEAWDKKRSIDANYSEMGLCSDPNKLLGVPKTKTLLQPEVMSIEKAIELEKQTFEKLKTKSKSYVIEKMEEEANEEQEKVYNLNENDVLFCIYMMEKYGDNYGKMAKDYQNHYQETPKQIKKKIGLFKNMKTAYSKYLQDKKDGVNFLDKLDEKF